MGRKASKVERKKRTAKERKEEDASESEDTDYEDDLNSNVACVRDGKFEDLIVRVRSALTRRKRPNIDSLRAYPINKTGKRGLCLIINNVHFVDQKKKIEDRHGSNIDQERFHALMEKLGYKVYLEVDRTKQVKIYSENAFSLIKKKIIG
ncbi:hypothetical protein niasHS_015590 [Heterodera schachtii]|uniref:Caspase family p20 domain-containing protein n=1 Tax=Heterodera schachtii TaxID=97005 RepID=A0ABD2HUT8_HETSC